MTDESLHHCLGAGHIYKCAPARRMGRCCHPANRLESYYLQCRCRYMMTESGLEPRLSVARQSPIGSTFRNVLVPSTKGRAEIFRHLQEQFDQPLVLVETGAVLV